MKHFTLLIALVMSICLAFAYQLPNSDFEDWSGTTFDDSIQLASWNASNIELTGFKFNFSNRDTGRSGYCAMIQDQDVGAMGITEVHPGYYSLGMPWYYLPSITQMNNATRGIDGGISFAYRPDSMAVWIKRTGNNTDKENYNILFYSWTGTAKGDRYKGNNGNCTSTSHSNEESDIRQALDGNECGTTTQATQVAEGWLSERATYSEWTQVTIPIYYLSDEAPEKCNVILSAGNYPNFRANSGFYAGNSLYVDDISLVYSSEIQQLYIDNILWEDFDPYTAQEQVYKVPAGTTTMPTIYAVRGAGTLTNDRDTTVTFPGRKLTSDEMRIAYGTIDGEPTTITVTAADGSSTRTYSIRMVQDEPYTGKVDIDGLYYNLSGYTLTAEVTSSDNNYSGLTEVNIPTSVTYNDIQYSVTSIRSGAFNGCSSLTSMTIGNSVTSIGEYAFRDCYSLTSVTIPSSVESIGYAALHGCTGLTSISVETGNPVYDSRDNCNAIIETAPNTLVRSCQNTIIPSGVISIGYEAFENCGMTFIEIPNSVTSIGQGAFSDCNALTMVTIPNSVTSIGDYAFEKCSSLISVTIPSSVTSIGQGAFRNCSGMTSMFVEAGNSVYDNRDNCNAIIETASNTLVVGCQNTVIPNSVTSIGFRAFWECSSLTYVNIPNGVTSIGDDAFDWCTGLISVNIPNSVTSIGNWTFNTCRNLKSVTIPSSVTSIGDRAFSWCSSLTSITCEATTPPSLGEGIFEEGVDKSIPLYVPYGAVEAYQAADQWNEFTNIQVKPTEETIVACGDEFVWHDMLLTESGDYVVETDSSRVLLHLTLIQPEYVTDSITIYDNDSLIWNGSVLYESGTYCDTLPSIVTGCDSITCLELTVLPYVPPTVTIFGEEVVITDPADSTVTVDEVDILGDATLIYTPADNTLTLTEAQMDAGDSISAAISYTGSDPLTIVLCDSSTIIADTIIASTSDIIITGSGTLVAEGVVPIIGTEDATITFDSVNMVVQSLPTPAAVRRRIRGGKRLDETGGPALSGFGGADFNKVEITPPSAAYGLVTPQGSDALMALYVLGDDGKQEVLTGFTLTAIADDQSAVQTVTAPPATRCTKLIRDGQLLIIRDSKTYNALGAEVR